MNKCCGLCKYSYCSDESDVSGFDCIKNPVLKITDLDSVHPLCYNGFELSKWRIISWGLLNG